MPWDVILSFPFFRRCSKNLRVPGQRLEDFLPDFKYEQPDSRWMTASNMPKRSKKGLSRHLICKVGRCVARISLFLSHVSNPIMCMCVCVHASCIVSLVIDMCVWASCYARGRRRLWRPMFKHVQLWVQCVFYSNQQRSMSLDIVEKKRLLPPICH